MSAQRDISATSRVFVTADRVLGENVTAVEGVAVGGLLVARELLCGENMVLLEMHRPEGHVDPTHVHDDHETVGYLLSGRMRWVIDGREFIAEPGCAWRHPSGVKHSSEALEDCVHVTVKSPARKPWETE